MTDDRHAEDRERRHEKARRGMRESGRSVKLLSDIIKRRADGDLPPKGKKKRGKRAHT